MHEKECKYCGKVFISKSPYVDYCSKDCARADSIENEQLCWTCSKACGDCSWSKSFNLVEGCDAEPVVVKDKEGDIYSYKIKKCPQYKKGFIGT